MKPLLLTMQAFGPYADCEIIDFTKLESRTMFVISGKTGAGKTTIFDGISFAIYGKASGEDRSGQDMRSQFAKHHTRTEVSLKFTLRDKTYFIHRSPQQERLKKSGEGTTTVGAKAELYELFDDGEKKLVGANVREVDEKIKMIIGLDANQFRQILMIPQGEFRKLLTSESKDKEQILQKLFHTEQYKRIEEKLKEDALYLKKECEKSVQARMDLLKGIVVQTDEELQQAIAIDEPNEVLILPLLANEIAATVEKSIAYDEQINETQQARDSLQQTMTKAEQIVQQFLEKEKLSREKETLAAKQPMIETLKERLKKSQRAAALEKQEQYYQRLEKRAEEVTQNFALSVQQVEKLGIERQRLEVLYQSELAKADVRDQATRRVHQLQQWKEAVASFVSLTTDVQVSEQQWKKQATRYEETAQATSQQEQKLEQLFQKKADAEKATLLFAETEREADKQEQLLHRWNKLNDVFGKLVEIEQVKHQQEEQFQAHIKRYEQEFQQYTMVEEVWRTSQAGMLAATLADGCACPVCGAIEHPNPAHLLQAMPSEVDMKQQKVRLAEIDGQKRKAESDFFQADSKYNAVKQQVSEQEMEVREIIPQFMRADLSDYQQSCRDAVNRLQVQLIELQQMKRALPALEEDWTSVNREVTRLRAEVDELKRKEEQAKMVYIEQKTKLASVADSLPEQIRTEQKYESALQTAITDQKKGQAAFEQAQTALQSVKEQESARQATMESLQENVTALQQELDEEHQKFVVDMAEQGFATYKEYDAAKCTEQERSTCEEEIQQFDKQWQAVSNLYHHIEYRLKDVAKPNLEELNQTFIRVDRELEQLRSQYNELLNAKQKNEDIQVKIMQMQEAQREIEEQYKVVGHLYEMAKGQNPFRITFERYVLAAFLDDILKEANSRLLKMTSGRYQLLRKIDPTRKNIQSGLELSVYDQYTSQERHVKTLSGGESFKASLALALGLADVVQRYAGGISLETMFIDEGFGTLDPESLDQAIEALIDIQSSGRLVGIISHVPELKERIDAQLEVVATQNGSKTAFAFSS